MNRRRIFNLPNCLTLSRFAAAPVMLWLVLAMRSPEINPDAWKTSLAALLLFVLTILTDLFDGMLARARHEVTLFGKIMDPVADSTFFVTTLFALHSSQRFGAAFPLWMPILVFYREVAMQILRRYAALKGNAMPAKFSGKAKTFIQFVALGFLLLMTLARDWTATAGKACMSESNLMAWGYWIGILMVAVNLLSLIEYSKDIPELMSEYAHPGDEKTP